MRYQELEDNHQIHRVGGVSDRFPGVVRDQVKLDEHVGPFGGRTHVMTIQYRILGQAEKAQGDGPPPPNFISESAELSGALKV